MSGEYPKINSIYKRDKEGNFIESEFSQPEFEYLRNNEWSWAEKIHGMNVRVLWEPDLNLVEFRGKTDRAQMPTHLDTKLASLFDTTVKRELFRETFQESTCFYGEGFGLKIQSGGGYIPDDVSFILFDIRIGKWWLRRDDLNGIAEKFGIEIVPIVGTGTLFSAMALVKRGFPSEVARKRGNHLLMAEGLVLKPLVDLHSRNGSRIITKIKHKDFKGDEK